MKSWIPPFIMSFLTNSNIQRDWVPWTVKPTRITPREKNSLAGFRCWFLLQVRLAATSFGAFGCRGQTVEVALIVVTIIGAIELSRAGGEGGDAFPFGFSLDESRVQVALIQATDRVGDVVEFADHGVLDFAHSDDQADDQQGANQNQFGGDNKTSFIIPELLQHFVFKPFKDLREKKAKTPTSPDMIDELVVHDEFVETVAKQKLFVPFWQRNVADSQL